MHFLLQTVAYMLQYMNSEVKYLVKKALEWEKEYLFETHTVHEVLWGYEEPTFKALHKWLPKSFNIPTVVGLFTGVSI